MHVYSIQYVCVSGCRCVSSIQCVCMCVCKYMCVFTVHIYYPRGSGLTTSIKLTVQRPFATDFLRGSLF